MYQNDFTKFQTGLHTIGDFTEMLGKSVFGLDDESDAGCTSMTVTYPDGKTLSEDAQNFSRKMNHEALLFKRPLTIKFDSVKAHVEVDGKELYDLLNKALVSCACVNGVFAYPNDCAL